MRATQKEIQLSSDLMALQSQLNRLQADKKKQAEAYEKEIARLTALLNRATSFELPRTTLRREGEK